MNAPETASKAGNKTITTLKEHIVEIISDSGEKAQRCGQSLGSIAARARVTFMIRLKKTRGLIYEYACHEGNYAMEGILAGARSEEAKARRAR